MDGLRAQRNGVRIGLLVIVVLILALAILTNVPGTARCSVTSVGDRLAGRDTDAWHVSSSCGDLAIAGTRDDHALGTTPRLVGLLQRGGEFRVEYRGILRFFPPPTILDATPVG